MEEMPPQHLRNILRPYIKHVHDQYKTILAFSEYTTAFVYESTTKTRLSCYNANVVNQML